MSDDLKAFGYAPGNYMGKCHACGEQMRNVDKYAQTCERCAKLSLESRAGYDHQLAAKDAEIMRLREALEVVVRSARLVSMLLPPSTKEGFEGRTVGAFDVVLAHARAALGAP